MQEIDLNKLPKHIAIIMDGNGRWAGQKGEERLSGHYKGVESVKKITEYCAQIGIQYLTLYAFSTENWGRPKAEVDGLMQLLVATIRQELPTLMKNNIVLSTIGNIKSLPLNCQNELDEAITLTQNNTGLKLILALSYSSRWEITEAVKKIAANIKDNALKIEDITETIISNHLTTSEIPDPELLIRTSGEHRISNYLLWQIAYTELYFTDVFWPDFNEKELDKAIVSYQTRERRFGLTSKQVSDQS